MVSNSHAQTPLSYPRSPGRGPNKQKIDHHPRPTTDPRQPHKFPQPHALVEQGAGGHRVSRSVKRDSRIVYSSTEGDLRKVRDAGLKERRVGSNRVEVRREVAGRRGKAVTTVS